jgi:phosphoribosylpyrophosphate synthetase
MTKDLSDIDYWDIYPGSSKSSENKDLLYFVKKACQSFAKTFQKERIFTRTIDTPKRHMKSFNQRVAEGCDDQFKSIVVNKHYTKLLEGKSVAIIDDFIRIGTSSETARMLLEEAGVSKIIFIAMGKFGADKNYYRYKYELSGSIYTGLKYKKVSHAIIEGELNPISNREFLTSLSDIV